MWCFRTVKGVALLGAYLTLLLIAAHPRAAAASTSLSAKTWSALSESDKLLLTKTAINGYKAGWVDAYLARMMHDAPAGAGRDAYEAKAMRDLTATEHPNFSRPLSDYTAAITAYCLSTGCPPGPLFFVGCLADHAKTSQSANCPAGLRQR